MINLGRNGVLSLISVFFSGLILDHSYLLSINDINRHHRGQLDWTFLSAAVRGALAWSQLSLSQKRSPLGGPLWQKVKSQRGRCDWFPVQFVTWDQMRTHESAYMGRWSAQPIKTHSDTKAPR